MKKADIEKLPCYPDALPDIEVNVIDVSGDYGCEGCEHFVVAYDAREGPNLIGHAMECDKGVWRDNI